MNFCAKPWPIAIRLDAKWQQQLLLGNTQSCRLGPVSAKEGEARACHSTGPNPDGRVRSVDQGSGGQSSDGYLEADMYLWAGETYAGFAIVDNERKQPYRYQPNYSWTAPGFEVELGPGTYTV